MWIISVTLMCLQSVGNPVRQILHPYSFSDPSAGLPTNEIATHFISSLLSPSGVLEDTLTFRNAKVDAGGFLTANKLLGALFYVRCPD